MCDPDYIQAHEHASLHRDEIERSEICGCFYCLAIFTPDAIERWLNDRGGTGQTALCPECGIDSVLGSASGFPLDKTLLTRMHQHWF